MGLIPSGVTDTPLWVMDSCQSHWELSVQPQGEWFGTVIVSLIATKNTLFSRSLDRLGTWASVSGSKQETPRDIAWKRSRWAAPDNGLWTLLSPETSHLLQTALMERWLGEDSDTIQSLIMELTLDEMLIEYASTSWTEYNLQILHFTFLNTYSCHVWCLTMKNKAFFEFLIHETFIEPH